MMGMSPKAFRYDAREPILDRPYGRAWGEPETIGHPKDVSVHRNNRFPEGGIQDDIRRLAAHARKGLEGLALAGDLPPMVADEDLASLADMARLGVV